MRTDITAKHFRAPTPILDLDVRDDLYLTELSSRAKAARYDASRHDAILNWIN